MTRVSLKSKGMLVTWSDDSLHREYFSLLKYVRYKEIQLISASTHLFGGFVKRNRKVEC